jgi:hypothetical protein
LKMRAAVSSASLMVLAALMAAFVALTGGSPAATAAAAVAAAAVAAAAEADIEWSVGPASAGEPDQPGAADGRISLRHVIDPGAKAEDAIAVTNLSTVAATFTVETGTGVVGQSGAFDIGQADPNLGVAENPGEWVTVGGLAGGELRLDPGETRVLPVTIAVPADTVPGDHPAGIAVGLSQGEGLTVTHRVGVRIHLRVAGEVTPKLAVEALGVSFRPSWIPFAPGELTVSYEVANTGNVRMGADLAARAVGPLGLGKSTAQAEPVVELLPGERVTRTVSLGAPALAWLGGAVTLTPVVVGEDSVRPPAASEATFRVAAIPWTGLMLTVMLIGAAIVVRRKGRVREAGKDERQAAPEPLPLPQNSPT